MSRMSHPLNASTHLSFCPLSVGPEVLCGIVSVVALASLLYTEHTAERAIGDLVLPLVLDKNNNVRTYFRSNVACSIASNFHHDLWSIPFLNQSPRTAPWHSRGCRPACGRASPSPPWAPAPGWSWRRRASSWSAPSRTQSRPAPRRWAGQTPRRTSARKGSLLLTGV